MIMLYWTRQRYVSVCMDTQSIQQKCDEPALCVQQIHVAKEIKFRSRYMMFVYQLISVILTILSTMCVSR